MSQIPNKDEDDNGSVAGSDFVQFDQPDENEIADQQAKQQQQGQQLFGLHQNSLDWAMKTGGSISNNCKDMKELKWMMANLQEKFQGGLATLQGKLENLELRAENHNMKENAEQKAKYQALETKLAKILSTQNEQHQKGTQLESKNWKLEEKLGAVEIEMQTKGTTENGEDSNMTNKTMQKGWLHRLWPRSKSILDQFRPNLLHIFLLMVIAVLLYINLQALDGKMDQLKDEFSKRLSEQQKFSKRLSDQQKQIMALEAQNNSLEQKLIETEQRAQMEKNKFEEIIQANQQKMDKFRTEMDENGQRLDYIWGQLMIQSKKLANPKGMVWSGTKTKASISEFGLKATGNGDYQYVFATEGYAISGEQCRKDNFPFPGTIVFYYEVTVTKSYILVSAGFSDGNAGVHASTNSYAMNTENNINYDYWLSGIRHIFEHPVRATNSGDIVGCGLLLNSKNKWAVFFTFNGVLLEKPAPINPTVDRLYPTVYIRNTAVEANFGDNLGVKPFKFAIDNCPELTFE